MRVTMPWASNWRSLPVQLAGPLGCIRLFVFCCAVQYLLGSRIVLDVDAEVRCQTRQTGVVALADGP